MSKIQKESKSQPWGRVNDSDIDVAADVKDTKRKQITTQQEQLAMQREMLRLMSKIQKESKSQR